MPILLYLDGAKTHAGYAPLSAEQGKFEELQHGVATLHLTPATREADQVFFDANPALAMADKQLAPSILKNRTSCAIPLQCATLSKHRDDSQLNPLFRSRSFEMRATGFRGLLLSSLMT